MGLTRAIHGARLAGVSLCSAFKSAVLPIPSKPAWAHFVCLERVMGIEPTLEAWEAPVLPLNYTRMVCCLQSGGRPPAVACKNSLIAGAGSKLGSKIAAHTS